MTTNPQTLIKSSACCWPLVTPGPSSCSPLTRTSGKIMAAWSVPGSCCWTWSELTTRHDWQEMFPSHTTLVLFVTGASWTPASEQSRSDISCGSVRTAGEPRTVPSTSWRTLQWAPSPSSLREPPSAVWCRFSLWNCIVTFPTSGFLVRQSVSIMMTSSPSYSLHQHSYTPHGHQRFD